MKTVNLIKSHAPILAALLAITGSLSAQAQPRSGGGGGMPIEARKNIHALFNNHQTIQRELKMTEEGYVATTESTDPTVAAALKAHVRQMSERLESGLRIRRWDPAFEEYAAHYDAITHTFEETPNGIRAVVRGRNPKAIAVAQNHAKVIVDFVQSGWEGHDRSHPAVAQAAGSGDLTPSVESPACCAESCVGPQGGGCCRNRARTPSSTPGDADPY